MMGRGHHIAYSPGELAWIERHCAMPRREAHAAFCARFRRVDIMLEHFRRLCMRHGWATGRTGCFAKGGTPANKGKKMPFNAASAKTQFKKGERTGRANLLYKHVGAERTSQDGYRERKIREGLPMQSRWRLVHLINWEAAHGPLPKGHCLKCLDGNRLNVDPANWELISRGLLPFLNGHRGLNYNQAAPEVRPTILLLAKLRHARFSKTRPPSSPNHV